MAKNKVSEWSSTPANNTDIANIDIAEGCSPSGINNAIREMMAQIKDLTTGADGDNLNVGGTLTVAGTSTLTGAVTSASGVTITSPSVLTGAVTGNVTGNLISVTNTINAGSFIVGNTYTIATVGTTNFISIGASSNTVGVRFTATGVGAGTGTATTFTGRAVNVTGTVAVENGGTGANSIAQNAVIVGGGTGIVSAIRPFANNNVLTSRAGATVNAGSFVVDTQYTILTVGTTDFTLIGAASNTVGVVFVATGVGTGTGTATTNVWESQPLATPSALSTATGSAPSYSARAYANIDGNGVIDLNGQTYAQAGTTISVTTSSAHPFKAGDAVYLNFTTGTATDGLYIIATAVNNTSFTVTSGTSTSTGGLVSIPLRTIRKGNNVSSVTAIATNSSANYFYVNFTTPMPDANSAAMATVNTGTVTVPIINANYIDVDTSANNPTVISVVVFD